MSFSLFLINNIVLPRCLTRTLQARYLFLAATFEETFYLSRITSSIYFYFSSYVSSTRHLRDSGVQVLQMNATVLIMYAIVDHVIIKQSAVAVNKYQITLITHNTQSQSQLPYSSYTYAHNSIMNFTVAICNCNGT